MIEGALLRREEGHRIILSILSKKGRAKAVHTFSLKIEDQVATIDGEVQVNLDRGSYRSLVAHWREGGKREVHELALDKVRFGIRAEWLTEKLALAILAAIDGYFLREIEEAVDLHAAVATAFRVHKIPK